MLFHAHMFPTTSNGQGLLVSVVSPLSNEGWRAIAFLQLICITSESGNSPESSEGPWLRPQTAPSFALEKYIIGSSAVLNSGAGWDG